MPITSESDTPHSLTLADSTCIEAQCSHKLHTMFTKHTDSVESIAPPTAATHCGAQLALEPGGLPGVQSAATEKASDRKLINVPSPFAQQVFGLSAEQ